MKSSWNDTGRLFEEVATNHDNAKRSSCSAGTGIFKTFVELWLTLGVKTCDFFLVAQQLLFSSLLSLFFVNGELHRFLHRG